MEMKQDQLSRGFLMIASKVLGYLVVVAGLIMAASLVVFATKFFFSSIAW
jgi:hypothetical protein